MLSWLILYLVLCCVFVCLLVCRFWLLCLVVFCLRYVFVVDVFVIVVVVLLFWVGEMGL